MSLPYFPPNKAKQQELENKINASGKVMDEQTLSENAIEHMTDEDYAEFIEKNERDRQSMLEAERKRKRASDLKIYSSIALGGLSVLIAAFNPGAMSALNWLAVVLGVAGIGFWIRYITAP